MKIVFISNVVYPYITGGAEKRIHEIGTRLAERGHSVTIYGRHFWDGPEIMEYEDMTLHAVSPERELYTGDDGERSILEALEFAKDVVVPLRRNIGDHDVVVASVFPYFPVLATELATLRTNTPLITTWHEVWKGYWDDYLGTLAPFGKLVERVIARVPQHPIAVSGITAQRLTTLGVDHTNIRQIPNGIDYEQIRATPPADDGFEVLFAGRLIEDKCVNLLLDAFDRVSEDETMGIVGDGPKRSELESQAENLDSADRITFTGFLNEYSDVLAQMRTARIFASPSTREGFGITAAEAMAADCVVIGADHPESAVDEVIDDAGFLAEPTVESLAMTLKSALNGDRPSKNPVERAQRYDWDAVADQAETAYQHAIDSSW